MNLVMKTPERHVAIIGHMIELIGCAPREVTHNPEVTQFIEGAEHGKIGTLIFNGWTFRSFPSHKIQAQKDNEPAVEF